MNEYKHHILKELRAQGVKLTSQRLEVIELLTCDRSHPSALTIFNKARVKCPNISLSTVYYTLALLKKLGLIRELEFEGMDNRYDRDTASHLNLICTGCGKIEDFADGVPVAPDVIERHTGFAAHNMRLEYYGLCSQCR
ncbi:Fur family transcriptional regulator [Geobacter sp. SVR]|uniref:Fur family transcriptional regulator n=1 Tax=Geobacter sp. SVR TaxID=2495594 RepID=UPI001565BB65|nr:Fur family transcriptional regulator [Geobacter sp. SVR]